MNNGLNGGGLVDDGLMGGGFKTMLGCFCSVLFFLPQQKSTSQHAPHERAVRIHPTIRVITTEAGRPDSQSRTENALGEGVVSMAIVPTPIAVQTCAKLLTI